MTPVTTLKIQLQLSRRSINLEENLVPPPQKLAKSLDISIGQVARITTLINDLLDVSRLETGFMSYNFERVDFSNIVCGVIDRFFDQIVSRGIPPKITFLSHINIECDIFRIEQVITNLVTNAIKYGEGSAVHVEIREEVDFGAKLIVSDLGMGIAKEHQQQIFNRFERAISHDHISGLGLGLYITKQIVEAHGGSIEVVSELGKGSVFIVKLPFYIPIYLKNIKKKKT